MIRLSKLADYGIVIVTHLARAGARSHATHEIAVATHVPAAMTAKILKQLARAGLLASQRGVRGGYALARAAAEITVADVVEALDGPIAITSCVDTAGSDCVIEQVCPARTNWQRINHAVRDALDTISLDEMAHGIPAAFLSPAERVRHAAAAAARPPAAG
jgi:FeS assembly SUF system regulator